MATGRSMAVVALGLSLVTSGHDCTKIPGSIRVEPIGKYSNMRFTEEHQYGQTLELWRAGCCVIGFLLVSEGLAGDTPTGLLEHVSYDPRTGTLSFTARLSLGITSPGQPSRDVFTFTGKMTALRIAGQLSQSDAARQERVTTSHQIVLRKQREVKGTRNLTFAEWGETAQQILKFRGPRW